MPEHDRHLPSPLPCARSAAAAERGRGRHGLAAAALVTLALGHGDGAGARQPDPSLPPIVDAPGADDAPREPLGGADGVALDAGGAFTPPPAVPFEPPPGDRPPPPLTAPVPPPVTPPPPFPTGSPPPAGSITPDGTVSVLAPAPPTASPPTSPPGTADAALPAEPPHNAAAVLVARALAPPYAAIPGEEGIAPRPVPLLEALERSGDRSRRLWITQAYWKLAAAGMRHRYAVEAEERLSLLAPGGSAEDLVHQELSLESARARSASAGAELVTAQQELADLVRLPVTDVPAMAADHPLTAAYQTHFETIFATRPATGRVRAIHRQLPLEHRAIVARAQATFAAVDRFTAMETLNAQGKKPIGAVITANEGIVTHQEAFCDAVLDYNLAIAEYVMAVADLSVPDERFATMLIGQPLPWRPSTAPGDRVIPVSGQLPRGAVPVDAGGAAPPGLLQSPAGFAPVQAPPSAVSPPRGPFAPGG